MEEFGKGFRSAPIRTSPGMRTRIAISLSPSQHARLSEIAAYRNSPQKHVWRARIVLLSAKGVGAQDITLVTGSAGTCVWRWQQRFMEASLTGLLVGKTRPSRIPQLDESVIRRVRVWLTGISPMVWRRVLVPASSTLRELHGVIQVAMGWEGIHLYNFHLRAERYGSWEVAASSPDVALAALRFRKGARFVYEYDLNIPWRHEVRIEDRLESEARKTYPVCTGGDGACPPEDCGGPESFMARRDDRFSLDALEDLDTMMEVVQQIALKDGSEVLALDRETLWRLEDALERGKARERAQGRPFLRRHVNASFRTGEHHTLMHQQW